MNKILVSTPSRICLFGEHQDYLGLEVIACAIDLRFFAEITPREDSKIVIRIRDSKIDTLGMENTSNAYEQVEFDVSEPIVYEKARDYLRSTANVLLRNGYELKGANIKMDSQIPIGKGMCSSSTMIVVLIKALLEAIAHPDKEDPKKIAYLAYLAEVAEFKEPGGMMDHYASALGGFVNLDFAEGKTIPRRLDSDLEGVFILFDSKEQKNTTKVLADAKIPTLEAVEKIGVGIKELLADPEKQKLADGLDEKHKKALLANVDNYKILLEAKEMLLSGRVDPVKFGGLIYDHHKNLRDGLGVSTPKIDEILKTAMENGALGGKINGSGGGGCCFVYAYEKDVQQIIDAVTKLGYPSQLLKQDTGVRVEAIE